MENEMSTKNGDINEQDIRRRLLDQTLVRERILLIVVLKKYLFI
jgi:hypothetical protein